MQKEGGQHAKRVQLILSLAALFFHLDVKWLSPQRNYYVPLISDFRRVLKLVCFLLGVSPASSKAG
jgi:hypothetical protein